MNPTKSKWKNSKKRVNGLIIIDSQIEVGGYTIISFDSTPRVNYSKVIIDGREYTPKIVYDLKNSIAIAEKGSFVGKEIRFTR